MKSARIPPKLLVLFTRQLAVMVRVGVPLLKAMETLSEQPESPAFSEVVCSLIELVNGGLPLSAACGRFPRIFPTVYVRMLKVAEATGRLHDCLEKLAFWAERDFTTRQKLSAALTYPLFVLTLTTALTLVLFVWVFPPLLSVLQSLEVELPWNTRLLAFLSRLVLQPGFWIALVLTVVGIIPLWANLNEEQPIYLKLWRWGSRLPFLGQLLIRTSLARYCHAATTLIQSGCDVTTTWTLAAESCGNPTLAGDAARLTGRIRDGWAVADSMKEAAPIYGRMLIQIARLGAESGEMASKFERSQKMLDEAVELSLASFTAMVEPVMLGLVSIGAGFSLVSIFLPLYSYLNHL